MEDNVKYLVGFLALLIMSLVILGVYSIGKDIGAGEITAQWQAEREKQRQASIDAMIKWQAQEAGLHEQIDKIKGEHHEALRKIAGERDAIFRELQRRTSRPNGYVPTSSQPTGAQPTAACSADQLYKQDAEFLAGEAARADTLNESLTECRAAYDAAQKSAKGDN